VVSTLPVEKMELDGEMGMCGAPHHQCGAQGTRQAGLLLKGRIVALVDCHT
jgi:hypothetical protein